MQERKRDALPYPGMHGWSACQPGGLARERPGGRRVGARGPTLVMRSTMRQVRFSGHKTTPSVVRSRTHGRVVLRLTLARHGSPGRKAWPLHAPVCCSLPAQMDFSRRRAVESVYQAKERKNPMRVPNMRNKSTRRNRSEPRSIRCIVRAKKVYGKTGKKVKALPGHF